jgi:hypothetical protein
MRSPRAELFVMGGRASLYVQKKGLTQIIEEGYTRQGKNALLDDLRLYDKSIINDLEKLGVFDPAAMKKPDPVDEWRDFIDG